MKTSAEDHLPSITLTRDAEQHPTVFAAAFNSGDPGMVEQTYEASGILVAEPGHPLTGLDRVAANARFLELGLPINVRTRHVYVVEDIALLIVDWSISGADPDGGNVHIEGTATDVARRGSDGTWRYIIDNPFGTA